VLFAATAWSWSWELLPLLARGTHRLAEGISHGDVPLTLDGGVTLVVEGGFELLIVVLILRSRIPWINTLRARLRLTAQRGRRLIRHACRS
jgi:hypothetical protein